MGSDTSGSPATAWARWRQFAEDDEAYELLTQVVVARRDAAAARASLDRLLGLCRPVAERLARTYVRSETDVADVVQEALLAAARHLPDLRDPRAFPHWFAALVHNACRQGLRRERRHQRDRADLPGDLDEPAAWELVGLRDTHADAAFDAVEVRDRLVQLLRLLPPRERDVVARAYLDDRPQHEIARREGVSPKAVESLLYRGIRRLRAVVTQCGAESQELALWCPHCGQRRLVARLEPGNGPDRPIHVRAACPACPAGRSYLGLPLARYPTLEGALIDGMAGLGAELLDVVRAEAPRCIWCRGPLRLDPGSDMLDWVSWSCRRCRAYGVGTLACVAAGLPAWRAFWESTPRLRFAPARAVERSGEARIELTAWDDASGRAATLSVTRETLAVRALEVAGR